MPYSRRSIAAEVPREQHYLFYTMFALCLTGLLGITITGDAFNLFVFLEISSLSTYVLIALGRDRRALLAAYQYLIMGTIGATFIVIGVGLLYLMTGTLNLADMAQRLPDVDETRPVLAALAFLTVGISLKLALFPLHLWLPNAYTYAPSAVTAFLAATATKVSVYVLLRFYFSVFGESLVFEAAAHAADPAGAVAGRHVRRLAASPSSRTNLKRLFAYSSVAQIGYITLGHRRSASVDRPHRRHRASVQPCASPRARCSCCSAASCCAPAASRFDCVCRAGPTHAADHASASSSPACRLIGVPGTAGFISKWYLVAGRARSRASGGWSSLIVASSLLAVVYVWRFVEAAYLRAPAPATPASERGAAVDADAGLGAGGACIYFGFDTSLHRRAARRRAAQMLFGARRDDAARRPSCAALLVPLAGALAIAARSAAGRTCARRRRWPPPPLLFCCVAVPARTGQCRRRGRS